MEATIAHLISKIKRCDNSSNGNETPIESEIGGALTLAGA